MYPQGQADFLATILAVQHLGVTAFTVTTSFFYKLQPVLDAPSFLRIMALCQLSTCAPCRAAFLPPAARCSQRQREACPSLRAAAPS